MEGRRDCLFAGFDTTAAALWPGHRSPAGGNRRGSPKLSRSQSSANMSRQKPERGPMRSIDALSLLRLWLAPNQRNAAWSSPSWIASPGTSLSLRVLWRRKCRSSSRSWVETPTPSCSTSTPHLRKGAPADRGAHGGGLGGQTRSRNKAWKSDQCPRSCEDRPKCPDRGGGSACCSTSAHPQRDTG
jgi:hypothetical protein